MRPLLPVLLLVGASLAGCFHSSDEAPVNRDAPPVANGTGPGFIPPPAIVLDETNKTVNGTGGKPHYHDYWAGRNRVVLFERDLEFSTIPVLPEGGPSNVFSAETELPPGILVYEGTGQVEILVKDVAPTVTGLKVRIKTAMDNEFRPAVPLTPGSPLVVPIKPEEADMPHATNSLWEFRFLADGALPVLTTFPNPSAASPFASRAFNFTLTVVKARDVSNWPGHPDFYGGKAARVVLDVDARTETVGAHDAWLYGSSANNVQAERLVSMGTKRLQAFVNVTNADSPVGDPTGYILEYRNATGDWLRVWDSPNHTKPTQSFPVPVFPDGLDSPYAPQSRWMFRLIALFQTTPENPTGFRIGLCPGCFPYTIDYHITVIAYPHDDPEAGMSG